MSYKPLTSFKPRNAPPVPGPAHAVDQRTSSNSKGKARATEQDELAWEQQGYRALSSLRPPPPTLPPDESSVRPLRRQVKQSPVPVAGKSSSNDNAASRKRAKVGAPSNLRPLTSLSRSNLPQSRTHTAHQDPGPSDRFSSRDAVGESSKTRTTRPTPVPPLCRTNEPLTSRSTKLFQQAQTRVAVDHKHPRSTGSVEPRKPLTALHPPPPLPTLETGRQRGRGGFSDGTAREAGPSGADPSLVEHDDSDSWFSSPEKKGAGGNKRGKSYLPEKLAGLPWALFRSGIAARAHSILQASKTDHTLWLHDISRKLHSSQSSTLEEGAGPTSIARNPKRGQGASTGKGRTGWWDKHDLEKALDPDLKLVILEVIAPPNNANGLPKGGGAGGGGGVGSHRTVLTRCRLDLSPSRPGGLDPSLDPDGVTPSGGADSTDPDLTGLVLFSLHHHQGSSSSSSSSAAITAVPYPQVRPTLTRDPSATSKTARAVEERDGDDTKPRKRTLFIPQGPLDMRAFSVGIEVWVFGEGGSAGARSGTTSARGISEVELNEDEESWTVQSAHEEPTEADTTRATDSTGRQGEADHGPNGSERQTSGTGTEWARVRKGLIVTKFGILV